MKTNIQFRVLVVLTVLCAVMSSFAPLPGAHNFQVYLDDKLVIDQYAKHGSTGAPNVIVDPAENHKQLVVKYNECGRTVSGRAIIIKDSDDKVLKEFKFEGSASGLKDAMTCSVKDILALKQASGNKLKMVYSSIDFPEGQQVATIVIGPGTNTALK
jgi:hypothetical protein